MERLIGIGTIQKLKERQAKSNKAPYKEFVVKIPITGREKPSVDLERDLAIPQMYFQACLYVIVTISFPSTI